MQGGKGVVSVGGQFPPLAIGCDFRRLRFEYWALVDCTSPL